MPMATHAPIDPHLKIGAVRLAVKDLARSVAFYAGVLGLRLVSRGGDEAALGPREDHPSLLLSQLTDATPASPHATGLFHVAWLHPSRSALAASARRLLERGWHIDGASDHGVSEALYLSDPDGLGIEIYADRPRERWERPSHGHGVKMFTAPLDVADLLAQGTDAPSDAIAPETVIGHIHLKVGDVERAASFYHDVLGFSEQARMPSAAFLAADGYHHHVGLNSWQSRGASAPPATAPGLRMVEFTLRDADALGELARGIEDAGLEEAASVTAQRISLGDPDGNRLSFAAEPQLAG
jgi:catechol 2,3-dioxygenase